MSRHLAEPVIAHRRRLSAFAATAALASCLLGPPAVAARGGEVTKGTPYAAETIATITGTSQLHLQSTATTFDVCEAQSAVTDTNDTYTFDWSARYPQVTVPVATEAQLGAAYNRLRVPVEPTAHGTGGLTHGTFDIQGDEPPTDEGNQGAGGSDCTKQSYASSGAFTASGPIFVDQTYKDVFGSRQLFVFDLGDVSGSNPSTYALPDGTDSDPSADLQSDLEYVPTAQLKLVGLTPGDYNTVPANFPLDTLIRLAHSRSVEIPVNFSNTSDCSTPATDSNAFQCTVTWNYHFQVKLTRRFLYRTRRSYRK